MASSYIYICCTLVLSYANFSLYSLKNVNVALSAEGYEMLLPTEGLVSTKYKRNMEQRTFFPVGQGAFYSETHKLGDRTFTMVYDCGSSTLKKNEMVKIIENAFAENSIIDVLFISHFHADHVNGIELLAKRCKIKLVIMPLITNEEMVLVNAINLSVYGFDSTRIFERPEDFFGKRTSFIGILQTDDEDLDKHESVSLSEFNEANEKTRRHSEETDSKGDGANIKVEKLDEKITERKPSGTHFYISDAVVQEHYKNGELSDCWRFIPFNYRADERMKKFKDELLKRGLPIKEVVKSRLFRDNKNVKEAYKDAKKAYEGVKKAYKAVCGGLNESSMILYSGKEKEDIIYTDAPSFLHYFPKTEKQISLEVLIWGGSQSGCLYMGDINLNRNSIVADIIGKLGQHLNFVGTLQVPHHGSEHNFSADILLPNMFYAVFSYGKNNSYKHPSVEVLRQVVAKYIFPLLVIEDSSSQVIQKGW